MKKKTLLPFLIAFTYILLFQGDAKAESAQLSIVPQLTEITIHPGQQINQKIIISNHGAETQAVLSIYGWRHDAYLQYAKVYSTQQHRR